MEQTEKTEDKKPRAGKLNFILKFSAGLVVMALFYICVVHFTSLRFRVPLDPLGSAIYKAKSVAATTDVERAHFHISESERLVRETRKFAESGGHYQNNMSSYEKMVWHNSEATKYMLAAEESGVKLNDEGLVKRLCDSLGEQYSLITGQDVESINEKDKLYTRVNGGEDLQMVFNDIQDQLIFAMSW